MSDIKSPFPGMDPYLELPHQWADVHLSLIVETRRLLNQSLPDNFSVKIEQNLRLENSYQGDSLWPIRPDVYITRNSPIRGAQTDHVSISEPIAIKSIPMPMGEVKERWLKIINRDNHEVVTTIEIVSPYNKSGKGFDTFALKRKNVLSAGTHWVEIDLLRAGRRPHLQLETADYCALTIRTENYSEGEAWLMGLREPLVMIGVPLTDGYDDVPLPLQEAVENVYRDGQYWRDLPYHEPPPSPKLSDEDGAWAAERLEAWQKVA